MAGSAMPCIMPVPSGYAVLCLLASAQESIMSCHLQVERALLIQTLAIQMLILFKKKSNKLSRLRVFLQAEL